MISRKSTAALFYIFALAHGSAVSADSPSRYDSVWNHATLYQNPDNTIIQKFSLSGRLQGESAWFSEGDEDFHDTLWRRFRFGFKADVFGQWSVHLEGNFDLNTDLDDAYGRLTDAYIAWTPDEQLKIKVLKQSAGFTLDGATSSKKLLTLQRNNLTNNLWFTAEYFTGLSVAGALDNQLQYKIGVFSSDGSDELSEFDASYFSQVTLGFDFAEQLQLDLANIYIDYVYNDEHSEANTRDFSHIVSLNSHWQNGHLGLETDLAAGQGYGEQSNVWGLVLMPYFDAGDFVQWVGRYTYLTSAGDHGIRFGRYENEISTAKGDKYKEYYLGMNVFFYGHKLKWQTGVQYTTMDNSGIDGSDYNGWGLTTGLRVSW